MSGIALVEFLAVFAIIGVLLSILLPAIQTAREAARRSACQCHLKQIGIALHGYHSANRSLPIGARSSIASTFGVSWWIAILPYLEEEDLFSAFDSKSVHSGLVLMHPRNAKLVNGIEIEVMLCPSSPLPRYREVGSYQLMMPSYVGIAGSSSDNGFPESRVNQCCTPRSDGEISSGGTLFPNSSTRFRQVSDGTSITLAVGEASDFVYYDGDVTFQIDGGHPLGWITGTSVLGTPPHYHVPSPAWNITTVRYRPNERRFNLPGIHFDRGANNPLVSPHPNGVQGLFVDGSVRFLLESVDMLVLRSMATRDDGGLPDDF